MQSGLPNKPGLLQLILNLHRSWMTKSISIVVFILQMALKNEITSHLSIQDTRKCLHLGRLSYYGEIFANSYRKVDTNLQAINLQIQKLLCLVKKRHIFSNME